MAPPTAPTSATLISEALARCGESSPSSSLTTRAGLWMEEIKNDIWTKSKSLKSLQGISTVIVDNGQSRYSMPVDYAGAGDVSMRLVHGSITGLCQTAAANSLTLASTDTSTEDYMRGKEIIITSGTGVKSISQVTDYDTTTKVATVTPAWATTPVTGDGYTVIEEYYPLDQVPVYKYDSSPSPELRSRPCGYVPVGDENYSEFYLAPCPDDDYAVIIRYPVNIMTVDLTATLISTLYQKYRNLWLNGLMARKWEDDDDSRYVAKKSEYFQNLSAMVAAETYGATLTGLTRTCEAS